MGHGEIAIYTCFWLKLAFEEIQVRDSAIKIVFPAVCVMTDELYSFIDETEVQLFAIHSLVHINAVCRMVVISDHG
jgi:hypothetical protein